MVALEADHTYVLDDPYYGFPELPATFRTGRGPDDIAPGRDEIVAVAGSHNPDAACQESLYLTPEIVQADEEPWLTHAVQIATGPDFADATTVPAPLALGRGFCTTTVPWLEPGQEVWLRSRAVDLAGNAGPWSSPYHVEAVRSDVEPTPPAYDDTGVPSADRGCGCSAGPGPSAVPLVLALVLGRGGGRPPTLGDY